MTPSPPRPPRNQSERTADRILELNRARHVVAAARLTVSGPDLPDALNQHARDLVELEAALDYYDGKIDLDALRHRQGRPTTQEE